MQMRLVRGNWIFFLVKLIYVGEKDKLILLCHTEETRTPSLGRGNCNQSTECLVDTRLDKVSSRNARKNVA